MWILGLITAAIGFLFLDRMRESKRITVMETKLDAIIKSIDLLSGRVDLFIKTEVDTLKELAKG